MTEQRPGDVLDEAARLFDALRARMGGGRGGAGGDGGDRDADDVWGRATAEPPRIATGAPECRDCPVCRAIALARESGPDVSRHVREAGRSLAAAAFDVAAAFERARASRTPPHERNHAHEPSRAEKPSRADEPGRAEKPGRADEPGRADGPSGERRGTAGGDPWASATGGEPLDIG